MYFEEKDPSGFDEQYREYYRPQNRRKKKNTGLLAVLIVLALVTAAASWLVNFLDIRVDSEQDGLRISVNDPLKEPSVQEDTAPEAEPAQEPTQDSPVLEQQVSPASIETIKSDAEAALSLQAIYEKAIPSVASIICQSRNGSSTGTGIVMTEDGYVITNYHVIDGAEKIQVLLYDETLYDAELIGGDEPTDLAVLKVPADGLTPAEFGDSDVLRVGDQVVAIGDPLGTELRGTMTDGIVSAINRDLKIDGRYMTLIQTNAALNSGNSGGPLINCYGQVIGINTVKMSGYTSTATVEGLGFAIPVRIAKPIVDELISQGYISGRPAIGIEGVSLNLQTQFFYNLPAGVGVTYVEPGSDAAEQGLMADDVIVSFNGSRVTTMEGLSAAKEGCTAGDTAVLVVYRNGKYYELPVVLMDQTRPELQ